MRAETPAELVSPGVTTPAHTASRGPRLRGIRRDSRQVQAIVSPGRLSREATGSSEKPHSLLDPDLLQVQKEGNDLL